MKAIYKLPYSNLITDKTEITERASIVHKKDPTRGLGRYQTGSGCGFVIGSTATNLWRKF